LIAKLVVDGVLHRQICGYAFLCQVRPRFITATLERRCGLRNP